MKSFVIDSNIPISFDDAGCFNLLLEFFDDENYGVYIEKRVLNEIRSVVMTNELERNIRNFDRSLEADEKTVEEVKDLCGKVIHTTKDNDYRVMALAADIDADFLVTNDRDILKAMETYMRKKDIPRTEIILMGLAGLLKYMYGVRRDLFGEDNQARCYVGHNCNIYEKVELPNSHRGIVETEWNVNMVQRIFARYSENIIKAV